MAFAQLLTFLLPTGLLLLHSPPLVIDSMRDMAATVVDRTIVTVTVTAIVIVIVIVIVIATVNTFLNPTS